MFGEFYTSYDWLAWSQYFAVVGEVPKKQSLPVMIRSSDIVGNNRTFWTLEKNQFCRMIAF
jgi:hypothetical protein